MWRRRRNAKTALAREASNVPRRRRQGVGLRSCCEIRQATGPGGWNRLCETSSAPLACWSSLSRLTGVGRWSARRSLGGSPLAGRRVGGDAARGRGILRRRNFLQHFLAECRKYWYKERTNRAPLGEFRAHGDIAYAICLSGPGRIPSACDGQVLKRLKTAMGGTCKKLAWIWGVPSGWSRRRSRIRIAVALAFGRDRGRKRKDSFSRGSANGRASEGG
jgi:hypothetical protein